MYKFYTCKHVKETKNLLYYCSLKDNLKEGEGDFKTPLKGSKIIKECDKCKDYEDEHK